jgi:hypothetical protein
VVPDETSWRAGGHAARLHAVVDPEATPHVIDPTRSGAVAEALVRLDSNAPWSTTAGPFTTSSPTLINWVRTISTTGAEGLKRGLAVTDRGGPFTVPVGEGVMGRVFDVTGNAVGQDAVSVSPTPRARLSAQPRREGVALAARKKPEEQVSASPRPEHAGRNPGQ